MFAKIIVGNDPKTDLILCSVISNWIPFNISANIEWWISINNELDSNEQSCEKPSIIVINLYLNELFCPFYDLTFILSCK